MSVIDGTDHSHFRHTDVFTSENGSKETITNAAANFTPTTIWAKPGL